ncbi:MAG: hypothetical protein HY754_13840 [Nitrospirae bacterium]|nr:hypothetical protein [Nitrospirota bacterium]
MYKQVCGNNAAAMFLSGIILALKFSLNAFGSRLVLPLLFFSIVLFLLSIALIAAYRRYMEMQEIWEDLYLGQKEK